jgi:peptidoglycan/LPS O-acetylase OafA/YrhL
VKWKRGDIQGLRALAVILVITNHVFGWPGGGFVGVDVFFVVSGFLITGLLLREHERTGKISFLAFYKRRVKRILPAAMAVLAVTIVAGYAILPKLRFEALAWDAVWAALFSSNWRSIVLGTDYMHVDDALSPLQHYWSLSIEEQFYFVWPVLLVIALTLGVSRPRLAASVVITSIGLLSFAFALWETSVHPTSAYFSTFSRTWELAAGALLALGASRVTALPHQWRPLLAWGGLAAILAGAFLMTDATPFPGPWAVVPVVGTLAVLAAGTGGEQRALWPLTNPWSGYVGNLSYSLYLWHFPVLVFSTMFLAETPRRLAVVAIVVTALLSVVSYHFVENPVRYQKGAARVLRPMAAVSVVAIVASLTVSYASLQGRSDAAAADTSGPSIERVGNSAAATERWALVDEALEANSWPTQLDPPIDDMQVEDRASEWVQDGCLGNEGRATGSVDRALTCSYGDPGADKVAMVLGDSTAISWVPGVRAALEPLGYRVDVFTFQQCPAVAVETKYSDGSDMPDCQVFRAWAMSRIAELHPDLVVAASVPATLGRLKSGASGDAARLEWESASRASMAELSRTARDVVVLQSPPTRNMSDACELKGSTPADCYLGRSPVHRLMLAADRVVATDSGTRFVETDSWFCSPDGRCPAFVGTSPVTVDGPHLTQNQAKSLASILRDALVPIE